MPDMEKVKAALSDLQALYAVLLGARRKKEEIELEAHLQILEAKVTYENVARGQQTHIQEAQTKIDEATDSLKEAQAKAFAELGIAVDFEPVRIGGHTRV